MIEVLKILSCLSYPNFLQILGKQDDYYTQGKFNDMKQNLAVFLCELDEQTAGAFIEYAQQKTGGEK